MYPIANHPAFPLTSAKRRKFNFKMFHIHYIECESVWRSFVVCAKAGKLKLMIFLFPSLPLPFILAILIAKNGKNPLRVKRWGSIFFSFQFIKVELMRVEERKNFSSGNYVFLSKLIVEETEACKTFRLATFWTFCEHSRSEFILVVIDKNKFSSKKFFSDSTMSPWWQINLNLRLIRLWKKIMKVF